MFNDYIEQVFWIQNQIKLLHWQTVPSGYQHKTLDKFYNDLSDELDRLVEASVAEFGDEILTISDGMFIVTNNIGVSDLLTGISEIISKYRIHFEGKYGLINILDDIDSLLLKYKYLLERLH